MTLSAASSRSVPYLTPDELAQSYFYEQDTASRGASRRASDRRLHASTETASGSKHSNDTSSSNSNSNHTGSSLGSQQRKLQQQQQHKLTSQPPVTVYGRCFESLTVCKLQDPRGFPDSVARPIWSSAQLVRQFWEQQHGAKYKVLRPQHRVLKQGGVLRVVVAVRGSADARSILNLKVRMV
jgi:hypothetical protein